ncbi:MAG: DnaJ domain-containing protein [Nitrosopumilaceae archaeon]|nr:DnaJ domain-containing protein [Nitrosopumilaceae archaeon]NIU02454.1 DnaJ domain-containing protein [Nitrosopumilaceae archaeon]NIU88915.1 DnaJ domain-containing protein [Nitrosopumilaceae archaeon]NIV67026.1 DnaJ domain-containing protein [Nitrosopumilaceae archaeon]NIX63055.1 DnaJ domain-containing protein [Nitrosopumilaceae archaeon]
MMFETTLMFLFQKAFGQSEELQMELVVTEEQRIIIFVGFIIAVAAIFLYLARDSIRKKTTSYDYGNYESKKDRTFEKYHSDWQDDYEDLGSKSRSKIHDEFRKKIQSLDVPNYYKVLGISHDATKDQIKKRYRELAKELHPDRTKSKDSQEKMAMINEAYEVLSDKELREKYDRYQSLK